MVGIILVNFLILCSFVKAEEPYQIIYPNIDPQAVCLDGSPGALFFHQGSEKNKILIYMFGGSSCNQATLSQSIQTCYQRSKTRLGSSKLWGDTYIGQGYLSTDPKKSSFANWTKALFIYCDGLDYQGYNKQPYEFKGSKIYIRGSPMTRQNIKWLIDNHNLVNAQKIVFTGLSAGAFGCVMWTNYLQGLVKDPSVVYTIPDSVIFTDYSILGSQTAFKFANVDESTPFKQCNINNPTQPWKCYYIVDNYKYIKGKLLVIDSQYDIWQVIFFRNITCPQKGQQAYQFQDCSQYQVQRIQNNRMVRRRTLQAIAGDSKNSLWSISCSIHGFASLDGYYNTMFHQVPMKSGNTVKSAIDRFVFNNQRILQVDNVPYPYNQPCAV